MQSYIPPVPTQMAPGQERLWLRVIAEKLNHLLRRANVAQVTLTANATTTPIYNESISPYASVHLTATSATAAAATGLWVELGQGAATIHHNSDPATDRRFSLLVA